jgi:hypothetical protein
VSITPTIPGRIKQFKSAAVSITPNHTKHHQTILVSSGEDRTKHTRQHAPTVPEAVSITPNHPISYCEIHTKPYQSAALVQF